MMKRGRPKWHSRVRNAIIELGKQNGYEPQRGIVYYRIGRRIFEYHPDVLWIYDQGNRFKPSVFVWEIESGWDLKKIAGDTILSVIMLPQYTSFFKEKETTSFGRVLKKDVTMPSYRGPQRATYRKGLHRMMNLNATHIIVVTEHEGIEYYFQRYLHSMSDAVQYNGICDVVSVPHSCLSKKDVLHRLAHLKAVRKIV
jgi:hypothetical protein